MAGLMNRIHNRGAVDATGPRYTACDPVVVPYVEQYIDRLALPTEELWITTDRSVFGTWLRRRIASSYGGAYVYLRRECVHAILINLERVDLTKPKALEVVVAEELLHMRDHVDGDHRRHSKHGYDRIAYRVADLTGTSMDEIRSALIPISRRPFKYIYACPNCGIQVHRKRRGRWSCSRCSHVFDPRFVLQMIKTIDTE